MNEKELFQQIADGNENAFRELFTLYMPQVYPMIFRMVEDADMAEDILQDTFLSVWTNRGKLPGIGNPRAWLLRIAYYKSLTALRNLKTHRKAAEAISIELRSPLTNSTTEESLTCKAIVRLVRQAVEEMPPQQRKVYLLSREKGYNTREIAGIMELSEQSVKNTMVRALKFIRASLEKAGYSPLFAAVLIFLNYRYYFSVCQSLVLSVFNE